MRPHVAFLSRTSKQLHQETLMEELQKPSSSPLLDYVPYLPSSQSEIEATQGHRSSPSIDNVLLISTIIGTLLACTLSSAPVGTRL